MFFMWWFIIPILKHIIIILFNFPLQKETQFLQRPWMRRALWPSVTLRRGTPRSWPLPGTSTMIRSPRLRPAGSTSRLAASWSEVTLIFSVLYISQLLSVSRPFPLFLFLFVSGIPDLGSKWVSLAPNETNGTFEDQIWNLFTLCPNLASLVCLPL